MLIAKRSDATEIEILLHSRRAARELLHYYETLSIFTYAF